MGEKTGFFSFFSKKTTPKATPVEKPQPNSEAPVAASLLGSDVLPSACSSTGQPEPPKLAPPYDPNAVSPSPVIYEAPLETPAVQPVSKGFFQNLQAAWSSKQQQIALKLKVFFGRSQLTDAWKEELTEQLLLADVGLPTTEKILARLTEDGAMPIETSSSAEVSVALKRILGDILRSVEQPLLIPSSDKPFVILMVGVNGAGKTTMIGKLAHYFQQQGKRVLLAAGDTFRAGAVEQLVRWGRQVQVPVISQGAGADSASVIFDALQAATARKVDVVIADTAGRLQTQQPLAEELKKIVRVLKKIDPTAPHELLLVLDATIGQNSHSQVQWFNQAVGVTGLALTKLDGTAKGGVIFSLAETFQIPIRFTGLGEAAGGLGVFETNAFMEILFPKC